MTLKAHPSPKILSISLMALTTPNTTYYSDIIAYLISQVPSLMDAGLSGYTYVARNLPKPVPIPGLPDTIDGMFGTCILQDAAAGDVEKLFKPLNETLMKRWPGQAVLYTSVIAYDSFLAWYDVNYDGGSAGGSAYLVSRLLDRKTLTSGSAQLRDALVAPVSSIGGYSVFLVGGKGVIDAKPRGGSNAVNSAWRSAHIHACKSKASWKESTCAS
jgi:hypothetical protein